MKNFRDNELEELQKYMQPESSEQVRFGNIGINKSQIEKIKTISVRDSVKRPTSFGGVLNSSGVFDVIAVFQGDKNQDFYFEDFSKYLKNSSVALMEVETSNPQIQLNTTSYTLQNRVIEAGRKGLPTIYAGYGDENAKVGVLKVRKYSEPFLRKPRYEIEKNVYSLSGKLETNNTMKFGVKDGPFRKYWEVMQ